MKKTFLSLSVAAFGALAASTLGFAAPAPNSHSTKKSLKTASTAAKVAPLKIGQKTLRGEAFFLERIALPPGAKLHVSLIGRVAGAEYLPLATTVIAAKNGVTPFALSVAASNLPRGPYRLQAWLIADNRLYMQNVQAQKPLDSLDKFAKIRLRMVDAPQNIDGIGDGKPLSELPATETMPENSPAALPAATQASLLEGRVTKLDRRALSPDSRIEIQLRDVSLADAPSPLILGQNIQLEGAQLPKSFKMALMPDDLKERRRYALSARVYEAGKLAYITDTLIEVSPANLGKNFELRVVPAAGK